MNTTNKRNEKGRAFASTSSTATTLSLRKGCWTEEEDQLLKKYVEKFGEGNWKHIPTKAGLNRCRKSCRLRWLNYLRPNIKRGDFGVDENDLIIRLHRLLGNRWSLIAGRIPGRTANDIKNYWNSCLSKKINTASSDQNNIINTPSSTTDDSAMNSEPLDQANFMSSSNQKFEEDEENKQEEEDAAAFWRSLFFNGVLKETKILSGENRENYKDHDDDDLYFGLGDLVQSMEICGGSNGL